MAVSNLKHRSEVTMNSNIRQAKLLKPIVLFIFIACGCVFGRFVYAGDGEAHSVAAMNLNAIEDQSDLILIGNLEIITQPDEAIREKKIL